MASRSSILITFAIYTTSLCLIVVAQEPEREYEMTQSQGSGSAMENWIFVEQPRCCSDCTFVRLRFKCKEKTCLHKCPWAQSSTTGNPLADYYDEYENSTSIPEAE